MKKLTLVLMLAVMAFWGCEDDVVDPPDTGYDAFNIETVMSVATATDANPEIVRIVPGTDDKAVFVASATSQLFTITYTPTAFTIDDPIALATGSATAEATSIDVSPQMDGTNYVAVCLAEADCARGSIIFVDVNTGTVVATVTDIGYNPDGAAFTKDGSYLVVACEDDREDRECKPADRHGGSVSIIDLRNGVANATLIQDYAVDFEEDSEPEHAETAADGTTVVSVQEPSVVMIFNANDAPLEESDITYVTLPDDGGGNEAEPDGLYISPDGSMALISNERNGTFQMMALPGGTLYGSPTIIENDLPEGWQVDARKATKRTEPEECALVEKDDKVYAILALQEAHAVVVYDVTDPASPVFDSMSEAGIDWENDNGMEKSAIGSEGLGAHPTNGVLFSANEREGSITMYTASWARE